MAKLDTTYRIEAPEIMDDFSLEGEQLRDALDKIAKINRLLGGNGVTLRGVMKLIRQFPMQKEIVILDAGCGNGDMLRTLADLGKKLQFRFKLIGVDANAFTIRYARKLSENYNNIEYLCLDIFDEGYLQIKPDITLCTLTLHHFKDDEILHLISNFKVASKMGIVVNDLHRSKIAYRLFQMICFVFRLNDMSREDGLVSILRGFKKHDLKRYSNTLNLKNYSIQWRWAFRYRWIISNYER